MRILKGLIVLSSALLLARWGSTAVAEEPATKPARGLATVKSAASQPNGPLKFQLALSPTILDVTHAQITNQTFTPKKFDLVDRKPSEITKEPAYMGKPKYGAFAIGDGPRSITYFAIDEIDGKNGKIFVDTNQNGDLTDDGPGDWDQLKDGAGQPNYNTFVTVHASWGGPMIEKESGTYRLLVAHKPGLSIGGYAKVSARIGEVKLRGKTYPVILAENSNDGLFTVPADGDLTRSDVSLYVDDQNDQPIVDKPNLTPDGPVRHVLRFNVAHPFQLDGHWYVARPSISGATLTVAETSPPGETTKPAAAAMMETLPVGAVAPDFTVQTPDGKTVKLSDFKGKVVVLDFWATWCGPCQAAMPGLETLYQSIKTQDVVFLSVNVLDDRSAFDAWIKLNAGTKYNFTFAYDPAGKSQEESIAVTKFRVFSIPRVFVISGDGKIAASLGGGEVSDDLATVLASENIRPARDH